MLSVSRAVAIALATLTMAWSSGALARADESRSTDGLTAHCTTVNAATVAHEVLERYEISGDENSGLISCVVQQQAPGSVPENTQADVYVESNPIGQPPEPVAIREVLEGDLVTYLGTYPVHDTQPLAFHVRMTVPDVGTVDLNFDDQKPRQ